MKVPTQSNNTRAQLKQFNDDGTDGSQSQTIPNETNIDWI